LATLILSSTGSQLFGPIGGFVGALAGSHLDGIINSELSGFKKQSSMLNGLKLQTSVDGASMPIVYGRMRISGQIIWAAKFKETTVKRRVGGKTGQKVKELYYSLSFAIGLCEGPINGIGKVWANGEEWDLSQVEHRLYLGNETQEPDPIIEAIEGVENAPNYKGLAYIVFEDLPLADFGDRIPQCSFEVFANPKNQNHESVEDKINAVCMIPGASEFAYATTPVRHVVTKGKEVALNQNQSRKVDLIVSLDNLARDLPRVTAISLVAAWFGTDLRAANCQIMPKVDNADKNTTPFLWKAAGLMRGSAQVVSAHEGNPAYGGSPDDSSLLEAIIEMKRRNISVTLNPFIMMDIPANNQQPNPWGAGFQAPYPWRGRISCYPAPGQNGTVDGSASATSQINNFFGSVIASNFNVSGQNIVYSGPNEWSYSRFILHMAAIAKAAGGVDTFLIGSELVGLTIVRGAASEFPFVEKLVDLAAQVRALLGSACKISYAADWTEYGAYYHAQSNNTYFPLDKLWANSAIDFVGIDYYAPISDQDLQSPRPNLETLMANVEAGEGFDYFYSDENARQNRQQTLITDTTYNEPWVFRQKDIRNWWQKDHFPRINGVRQTSKTLWNAGSKPIWLMEVGFPAVDKGGNRPSVFPDAKSAENGSPPFSNSKRDDQEQRMCLDALLTYWGNNNPVATQYQGHMIAMEKTHVWAWDARPYPSFPALSDVWRDADNYAKGHWIMGRMGQIMLSNILVDIANRVGVSVTVRDDLGAIDGYVIENITSAREAIEPLLQSFGINLNSEDGVLAFSSIKKPVSATSINQSDLIWSNNGEYYSFESDQNLKVSQFNFSSYSVENQYEIVTHQAQDGAANGSLAQYSAPIIGNYELRNNIARRSLISAQQGNETLEINPSLALGLSLEIGDNVNFLETGTWTVSAIEGTLPPKMRLSRPQPEGLSKYNGTESHGNYGAAFAPAPLGFVLDLPYPFVSPQDPKPVFYGTSSPWPGGLNVSLYGETIARIERPARAGTLVDSIAAAITSAKLNTNIDVHLDFGFLDPTSNYCGLMQAGKIIDIIYFESATLIGADTYRLSGLVRGLNGIAFAPALSAGCQIIILDEAGVTANLTKERWRQVLDWQFAPLTSPNAEIVTSSFDASASLPWSPCHLRAKRVSGGIAISFIPRENGNYDNWEMPSPLQSNYIYQIEILNQNTILRTINSQAPDYLYEDEIVDFGSTQTYLALKVAQFALDGRLGAVKSETIVIS